MGYVLAMDQGIVVLCMAMSGACVLIPSRKFLLSALMMFGLLGTIAACSSTGGGAGGERTTLERDLAPYTLGQGDELRVLVFGADALSGDFVVGPQGVVSYPLLGDLQVSGMTVDAFRKSLAKKLTPNYVRDPQITVEVVQHRPYYIMGEVNEPGGFAYNSGFSVMNAVALAGGFTYRADTKRVFIKHDGEEIEREYTLDGATPVHPGDLIRIAERRF